MHNVWDCLGFRRRVLRLRLPMTSLCLSGRMDPAGADLTNATAWVPVAKQVASKGFGQSGEDAHAYASYFHGCINGTFLEIGALDGALDYLSSLLSSQPHGSFPMLM